MATLRVTGTVGAPGQRYVVCPPQPTLQTKLEAKGLTMKDLGIQPHELVAHSSDTMRAYSRSPSSQSSVDKWSSPYSSGTLGSSPIAHQYSSRREPRSSQGLSASGSVPAPAEVVVAKT
jgi:hypothetical protein